MPETLKALPQAGEDWSGRDLAGTDLSGLDLTGINLRAATLMGVNLTGTILRDACLDETEFAGATLRDADLTSVSAIRAGFARADLTGATLFGANLEGASLSGANCTSADFRTAILRKASLVDVNLTGVDFTRADAEGAEFLQCDVSGAAFTQANLKWARLRLLSGYESTDWIGVDLRNVDPCGARLLLEYAHDENFLAEFRGRSPTAEWVYRLWWLTSDCGRSFTRWASWTGVIALIFGVLYGLVPMDFGDHETVLSPMYTSVVTLTTLGYGDGVPTSILGQVVVMTEVVLGYGMISGLVSIFANKMARRAAT